MGKKTVKAWDKIPAEFLAEYAKNFPGLWKGISKIIDIFY
jgi:hypothetical protein